ncbi:MAG: sugar phosphate isomerase/epimerase [Armatimonadota bacterium]|nr:sugar phosphate isomerase/epimerase [Armatimonadota bacterium]
MKLGVLTVLFSQQPLEQALDYIAESGLEAVELGSGNFPGDAHCNPHKLLEDDAACKALLKAVESRGLEISALSCHGNPLHPNKKIAAAHADTHRKSIELAAKLGINRVVGFSGCPGEGPNATKPNWVTCAWPPDFQEILDWQWDEVVIPWWKENAAFAKKHKVKICIEIHPGMVVYNTETMLRLREAAGETVGVNFDPSHLFWQGMDPVACIHKLGDAIYHFHAKDCRVYTRNSEVNGVNDTKSYGDEINRSWLFRTVGYGHGYDVWKDMISALRMVGYDDVLSIEHEDSLMSVNEGFQKAVSFLKEVAVSESPGAMWWA